MSNKLREIINDPQKNKDLWKGISQLNSDKSSGEKTADISIGDQTYKIQFVNPALKK